jgi:hypothetical protein
MTERFTDILNDLSPEEMDEFVSITPAPTVRRGHPVPDEIKLSVEEVRQALEHMPKKRTPEKVREERIRLLGLALIAKREMALVDSFVRVALGPEPTNEQREAMQAALGHTYRLGSMSMLTHQAKPVYAAAALADVKEEQRRDLLTSEPTKSANKKQKRKLEIIDAMLRTHNKKRGMPVLATEINEALERNGLKPKKPVSEGYLYKRRKHLDLEPKKTLRQTDKPKTACVTRTVRDY